MSLIRERGLVGAKNFWRLLADSNTKQKESLEAARRYNRQHKDDIAAKTKQTKKSWITWREATDYYLENGGTEKVATVAERQQKLDPEKRKALENPHSPRAVASAIVSSHASRRRGAYRA